MSGLRRLCRGSGRALAFVFAASVAWLLLDMAALRLSLGDAGGRLLREAAAAAAADGGRGRAGLRRGPPQPPGSPRPGPAALGRGGRAAARAAPGPPSPPPAAGSPAGAPPRPAVGRGGGAAGGAPAGAAEGVAAEPDGRRGARPWPPGEPPSPAPPARGGGTGGPRGSAAPRAAGPGTPPGPEGAEVGKRETSSENHFVLVSKEGIRPLGPAAPRLGSDPAGNSTKSRGEPEERQLATENGGGGPTANTITGRSRTPGATRGASPATPVTGEAGQERAGGGSPGTHRVLSLDATLAPRDPQAPGQFGHPVAVPDDKQEEAKSRWKEGNFNVYLSDLIPVDRAVADTRPAG